MIKCRPGAGNARAVPSRCQHKNVRQSFIQTTGETHLVAFVKLDIADRDVSSSMSEGGSAMTASCHSLDSQGE